MATLIRTGLTAVFERMLQDLKLNLTSNEIHDFSTTTLAVLRERLAGLQEQQRRKKSMQDMSRIAEFIEAMDNFSKSLDVFNTVENMAGFIWGPMKFLLLTASAMNEAFNTLLDAYQQLGERLRLLEQYKDVIEVNDNVKIVLEVTFRDIFDFHKAGLKYFRRPGWRLVLQGAYKNFNDTFQPVLIILRQHHRLLFGEASLEHLQQVQQAITTAQHERQLAEKHYENMIERERLERLRHLGTWLSAADVHSDHEELAERRHGSQSCQWIRRKELFRTWSQLSTILEPILCISGIPGAGKSVLASFIIDHLRSQSDDKVLFFYCRHDDPQRNTFVAMARSILWELAQSDRDIAEIIYHAAVSGSEQLQLKTQRLANHLLDTVIQAVGKVSIVLDGLDECNPAEQRHMVSWLKRTSERSQKAESSIRCLVMGQRDEVSREILARLPSIAITALDTSNDIKAYCLSKSNEIHNRFGVTSEQAEHIALRTALQAEGMFLFARLVMEHFLDLTNEHDLLNEKQYILDTPVATVQGQPTENAFMEKLGTAYSRILLRIVDNAPANRKVDALQLLKWLTSAIRPLKWREIQTMFSIDMGRECIDPTRQRVLDAKALCGSLVTIGSGGRIDLVHYTAKLYLERSGRVDPRREHLDLARLCTQHFGLCVFDHDVSDEDLDVFINAGCYGFLDYAALYWPTHLELGLRDSELEQNITLKQLEEVEEDLSAFMDKHYMEPTNRSHEPLQLIQSMKIIRNAHTRNRVLGAMASIIRLTTSDVQQLESVSTLKIMSFLFRVRKRLERLAQTCSEQALDNLQKLYGQDMFKCERLYCKSFHDGFETSNKRQAHLERHERPYHCPHTSCVSNKLGFTSRKDLETHTKAYHTVQEHDFPAEPTEQEQRRPIPSRNTGGRIRSEAKFECETCKKKFTRKYNLRSHEALHTDARAKACTFCNLTFESEIERRSHETFHVPRRTTVCRGTLSSGDKWGCDTRYGRAEALRRHWRRRSGQLCIRPLVAEESGGTTEESDEQTPAVDERLVATWEADRALDSWSGTQQLPPIDWNGWQSTSRADQIAPIRDWYHSPGGPAEPDSMELDPSWSPQPLQDISQLSGTWWDPADVVNDSAYASQFPESHGTS